MNVAERMDLIQGTPLQLGAKIYICPALNLKGMQELKAELALLETGLPDDKRSDPDLRLDFLSKLVMVTTAALRRNYPEINEDIVAEGLDFNNMRPVTLAVLGASGYVTTDEAAARVKLFGEAKPTGESTGTV